MMKPRANVNWLMNRKTNLGFNLYQKKINFAVREESPRAELILFGPELILFPTTIFERQYFPSYRTSVRTARVPARTFGIYPGPLLYIQILFFYFWAPVQTQAFIYTRIHSPLWTHTRTPYPYEHLREIEPAYHLKNYEVTVGASSSTGTSPPIESTSPKILK